MSGEHALLPCSSAGTWVHCSGWVLMNAAYPELEDTPASLDGDAAHEVGESMIRAGLRAVKPDPRDYIDKPASNGVIITEEMAESAEFYASLVLSACRRAMIFGGDNVGVEARLHMPQVHDHNWGTCDAYLFDPKTGVLDIWDFKFGHKWVDVFENWQLINYFAGVLNKLNIDGIADQYVSVRFHVVQPRAYGGPGGPHRTWGVLGSDLRGHVNKLANAADRALGPNPEFVAGEHCTYCPGRHACTSTMRSGWSLYEFATSAIPREMTPEQTGTMLMYVRQALKRLEGIETGLSEQVEHAVRHGTSVPGYAVEQTYGREKWSLPTEQVLHMGDLLGSDLRKTTLVTPNQARKAGMDPTVVDSITTTPTNGVRVVPDKSNRAKRLFT